MVTAAGLFMKQRTGMVAACSVISMLTVTGTAVTIHAGTLFPMKKNDITWRCCYNAGGCRMIRILAGSMLKCPASVTSPMQWILP